MIKRSAIIFRDANQKLTLNLNTDMGSRLTLDLFNMGNHKSKTTNTDTDNNGINQNLNTATTEIKNTIELNNNNVVTILIIIVALLIAVIAYFLYSKHMRCMKKRYTAPRPTVWGINFQKKNQMKKKHWHYNHELNDIIVKTKSQNTKNN